MIKAKWVLLTALFMFILGSLVCGVSQSMNVMILGRAIQGVGESSAPSAITGNLVPSAYPAVYP
jgi:MFS family permease